MRTGAKTCPETANTSSSAPCRVAGQCSPPGSGDSPQSAAASARTRGASVLVRARGRISRGWLSVSLISSWSRRRAAAQSGTPAEARAATAAGAVLRLAPAVAGWLELVATTLPHAVSPISAHPASTSLLCVIIAGWTAHSPARQPPGQPGGCRRLAAS